MVRALEIYRSARGRTQSPRSAALDAQRERPAAFRARATRAVTWPREALYARVRRAAWTRCCEAGLVEEVRRPLRDEAALRHGAQSMQAIGYKEIAAYLRGEASLEEAREQISAIRGTSPSASSPGSAQTTKIRWFDRSACADPSSFSRELAEYSLRKFFPFMI